MFVKSILRSVKRKVGEPILIVMTVMLAVAMFVSTLSLRSSIKMRLIDSYTALSGAAEIEATFSDDFAAYYTTEESDAYIRLQETVKKLGTLHSGYAFYLSVQREDASTFARAYSTDFSDLLTYNEIRFSQGGISEKHSGVIIGNSFAQKAGVQVGEFIRLTMYGSETRNAEVVGIAENVGPFLGVDIILSDVMAARFLSLSEDVKIRNRFFIELSEETIDISEAVAELREGAPDFNFASPINDDDIAITMRNETMLLLVIAGIVAVLGAILIYTAVVLVMKNRISLAALFRSVGATSGKLSLYLFAEIALYGVLGSLLGVATSFGISALMNVMIGTASASVHVGFGAMAAGLLFGLMLSFLSAFAPVVKVVSMPLYDMISYSSPIVKEKRLPAVVVGCLFIVFFIWSILSSVDASFSVGIVALLLLIASLFLIVPLLVKGISSLVMKFSVNSSGMLYVAASGAKENRHAHSGARLLCIALTAVIAVASLCGAATTQLAKFSSLFRADIMISAPSSDLLSIRDKVRNEAGVSGAYLTYIETKCPLAQGGTTVTFIAIRPQEAEMVLDPSAFSLDVDSICGARRIAISRGLAMKQGLAIGDSISIKLDGKDELFTIASFIDTPLTIVFSDLTGLGSEANACLVASSSDDLLQNLTEGYSRYAAVYRITDAFSSIIDLANAYIRVFILLDVIVVLFAMIGYFNNALASYRDRKHEYDLLNGVGADRMARRKLILAENAIVVLGAVILSVVASVLLLTIVQNILKAFGLYFRLLW